MASATGQAIVSNALITIGVLGQGESPSVSDSNDALAELNDMWDAWSIDEGLIFAVQSPSFFWPSPAASAAIGPGATPPFDVQLPSKIYGAYWIPTGGARIPLTVVNQEQYSSHRDLAASTALSPDELYPDWLVGAGTGQSTLFLWPVPTGGGNLELNSGTPFASWALGSTYSLPVGFQDAINYALAFRLMPRYGTVVAPQIVEVVSDLAQKSESRIRQMNLTNRQMKVGSEQNPAQEEAEAAQTARP